MGKSQSRPGSNWSWSYKRRENPEGDAYILRGCINTRYRDSEDNLWSGGGSSDPVLGYKSSHGTPCGSHEFDGRQAERPVGLAEDLCSLKVALPPEVTGSRCSLKVLAMQDNLSSPSKKLSPPSQSESDPRGTIGAVDCDVSLDAEKETQEWAFTLYDFDGHRRITREDLSSVLKSISEALACSVMLPPSGSRKLKLRLSVVSDQESEANASPKKSSQTSSPSHDNHSQQKSATTQSTSVPTTSPPSFSSPLSTKQETAENAFNRVRDHDMGDACRPPNYRHSFHGGHQCWQKDEKRSRRSRNHVRSQSATQADIAMHYKEQVSPERRHRKARKSSTTPDQGKAANRACKQIVNNGTNCIPQERPQENAERRSYYQELAGIEHQCAGHNHIDGAAENFDGHPHELLQGAAANVRTHGSQRQSKGSPHHRRSRSCEPQNQPDASGKKQPSLFMTPELFAKYEYAQRHHKDYHMQLLEASRARLEGYQPQYQVQAAKQTQCRHSIKRHSLPVQVVTTQYAAPQVQAAAARGKHRRKSRRHHTLQPLTVMKHEIMEKTEGLVYSPVTHKHQHHHHHDHHEHHHHHHYHHYHDINE